MALTSLALVERWPVRRAAAAVVTAGGTIATYGDIDDAYPLASVTKLIVAYAAIVAIEEGSIDLDTPAGPPGSTVRHLLAHASGLPADGFVPITQPATRRVYSNTGFEILGGEMERATGMALAAYVDKGIVEPLALVRTTLSGSPASGAVSCARDLAAFAGELLRPQLVDPMSVERATTVAFPGLAGVLPGFGQQDPNDWGLGFEIRGSKQPHWTGDSNSPATFGHFGQSGTFLWVDPVARAALVCVTDEPFGPWAAREWPALSDVVVNDLTR